MANDFVHLHVHSEYSMLDGLGRIKELVKEAKRLGQPALALTDHGVMHGAIEFFRACKENEIKPIVGIEAYQTVWGRPMGGRDGQLDRENYHILLLAKNMTGYRNLLKIASHSQLNGYYYKPRIDHDFLAKHAEGIICTTGCLGAEVPQLLMQGKEQEAYERFGWYVDVFGKENFYIELQEHSIPELIPVNKSLVPWSEKFGIGLLATNDVHYVKEADADPHEMLLCVQTGESIKSEKRMRLSDQSYFLKSREQMEATFRPFIDLPASAYENSLRIAEMCEVDLEDKSYHLPDMPIPEGYTYDTYLRHLTEEGLVRLYGERAANEDVQKRKDFELGVIAKMGFSIYFLIVADLCRFARSRNIWWNVRGSGAGSLVAYCTGITGIDPLKNNLIFERFLNPARVTMPDFDLDFPDDQREEMIRYTIEKYGKEQVAQIVTFGRMKARAAIKDVGRAQEIPLNQVNRIAQLIPAIPGKPVLIKDVMTEGHEFYNPELVQLYQNEPWVTSLLDYSMKLEGVTRHSGIHAAAVIVADKELVNYAPLMRPSKGSVTETVAQFEFPILESIGLLKVDFLGLSTLSVMREAGRLIKERHGIEYTLATIPFEGEVTTQAFKLLSSGEVSGVFQVESAGMRRVLTEMRPHLFEHIVATISLYRPGPLEYIPNYIRRLHGEEEIEFKHDALKPILTETLGIIIYQEQIIQVLSQLAGYTPGEADLVRRAISKKKASDIEKHKKIFVEGCAKNNIPKEAAEAIYGDIEFFARYGFNKSHAADYAVITVQTAYLKAHYPVEYMAALLLIERDKTEKVVNFINECRRMGISVLPPDVNYSGLDFEIQGLPAGMEGAKPDPMLSFKFPVPPGSAIRFGMAAVKMVGEGPVKEILAARQEGGPFATLEDFADRVDLRKVGKRPIECLIKVGAFDRFGKRSQLLAVIDQMVANSGSVHDQRASGQLSMFDLFAGGAASVAQIRLPNVEEVKGREKLTWEKELLGVYAASHPMQSLGIDMSKIVTCYCNELSEEHNGKNVTLAGMITSVRTINTKKGDQMAFVQLEDRQGQCEAVVFPRAYQELKDKLVPDTLVIMKGKAQTREGQTSLLVDSMQNYVDQAVAAGGDAPSSYQRPLVDMAPTFNGLVINEANAAYVTTVSDGFAMSDEDDFSPLPPEDDPFRNEMPDWLRDADPIEPMEPVDAPPPTPSVPTVKPPPADRPSQQYVTSKATAKAPPEPKVEVVKPVKPDPVPAPPPPVAPENGKRVSITGALTPTAPPATNGQVEQPHSNGQHGAPANGKAEQPKAPPTKVVELPPAPPSTPAVDKADAPPPIASNGALNRSKPAPTSAPTNGNGQGGHRNGRPIEGQSQRANERRLQITFRRSGDLERDKYRLKEIYDRVRDPRGRDRFSIVLESNGQRCELAFPNDPCSISERLVGELTKHFRVDVAVETQEAAG
jgi:DNA polymerase-3 subunit alpha